MPAGLYPLTIAEQHMQRQTGVQEPLAELPHRLLPGEVERPHLQLALTSRAVQQRLQHLLRLLGVTGA